MPSSRCRIAAWLIVGLLMTPVVGSAQSLDEASLNQFQFRSIGPTTFGGRVVDIDVDPTDTSTIYLATGSAGLWKTTNAGTTWESIFSNEGTTSIGDIAVDPQRPNIIWVGTGEANNQRSSYWGDGVYKSTDGGESWKHMGLPESHHIGRIVVDPTNSNVVYVAAAGHLYSPNPERGLYKTTNGGRTWKQVLAINEDVGVIDVVVDPQRPNIVLAAAYERRRRAWDFDGNGPGSAIYRSTDAGKTWERVDDGLPSGDIGRIGLDMYRENSRIIYATVANQNVQEAERGDITATVNADGNLTLPFGFEVKFTEEGAQVVDVDNRSSAARAGVRAGQKFTRLGGQLVTTQEALIGQIEALEKGDTLRVETQQEGESITFEYNVPVNGSRREIGGQIYRSEDSGATWKLMNEQPVGGTPAYYYGQIRIDPKDDKRLYVLSVPVYVSSDGGKTWSSDGARSVHVDHHALWINPDNPEHILLGNDGGFHVSYDRGETWIHVNNLPLAQFYAVGVDMQTPYHVYGGTQDNGSWGGPSGPGGGGSVGPYDWYRVGGGDGFYVQVQPEDANVVIAESQFGVIRRFDKRTGRSVSIRPPQSDPAGDRDRYNWNSPIVMSHHDSRVLYFGGNKLFKSYNLGDDWMVISPDLTTNDPQRIAGNVPHCTITTISESTIDRDLLMVGTDDGKVHWTKDGGESWTDLSNRFPFRPADWWCSRVELSNHDRNVAYVTFTGYREDDFRPFVFKTTDGGETWSSIAGNLPEGPVNVIQEDAKNPQLLYLGTEFGVFVSLNRGDNWMPLTNGLPKLAVHDLLVHPREQDLVVATHARGMYIADDITPLQEMTSEAMAEDVYLFEARPQVRYSTRTGVAGMSGDRRWTAENPPSGVMVSYYLKEAPAEDETVTLEIFSRSDRKLATLEATKNAGLNRVEWEFQRRRRRRGPSIGPGRYWAVLTVGEQVYEKEIEILADPNESSR